MKKDWPVCLICGKVIENHDTGDPRICEQCWKCPVCGVGFEFSIDSENDEISGGLWIDHSCDSTVVECCNCDRTWTSEQFERVVIEKEKMTKCPHCKGRGLVRKKKKTRGR